MLTIEEIVDDYTEIRSRFHRLASTRDRSSTLTWRPREWIKADADPNLADPICWFAPHPA